MMIAYLHLHFEQRWKMGVWNLVLRILKLLVVGSERLMAFSMREVGLRMR
jgi:hypothetical protein